MSRKNDFAVTVREGDVVDFSFADVLPFDGKRNMRGIIRSANKVGMITLFAGEEYMNFKVARITKITAVCYYAKYNPKSSAKGMSYFTNVYVELEDATGEEPKFVCENSKMSKTVRRNNDEGEWERPKFT